MKEILVILSFVLVHAHPALSQPAPSDDFKIAKAALDALTQEFGPPTTTMASRLGREAGQLAASVGAKESSREAGLRCTPSTKTIHCDLVEKGTNIILRSILTKGEARVAVFEIQKQHRDERMTSVIRLLTMVRKQGRWEVLKIEPGPIS